MSWQQVPPIQPEVAVSAFTGPEPTYEVLASKLYSYQIQNSEKRLYTCGCEGRTEAELTANFRKTAGAAMVFYPAQKPNILQRQTLFHKTRTIVIGGIVIAVASIAAYLLSRSGGGSTPKTSPALPGGVTPQPAGGTNATTVPTTMTVSTASFTTTASTLGPTITTSVTTNAPNVTTTNPTATTNIVTTITNLLTTIATATTSNNGQQTTSAATTTRAAATSTFTTAAVTDTITTSTTSKPTTTSTTTSTTTTTTTRSSSTTTTTTTTRPTTSATTATPTSTTSTTTSTTTTTSPTTRPTTTTTTTRVVTTPRTTTTEHVQTNPPDDDDDLRRDVSPPKRKRRSLSEFQAPAFRTPTRRLYADTLTASNLATKALAQANADLEIFMHDGWVMKQYGLPADVNFMLTQRILDNLYKAYKKSAPDEPQNRYLTRNMIKKVVKNVIEMVKEENQMWGNNPAYAAKRNFMKWPQNFANNSERSISCYRTLPSTKRGDDPIIVTDPKMRPPFSFEAYPQGKFIYHSFPYSYYTVKVWEFLEHVYIRQLVVTYDL